MSTNKKNPKLYFETHVMALRIMIQDFIKHHGPFSDDIICGALIDILHEKLGSKEENT